MLTANFYISLGNDLLNTGLFTTQKNCPACGFNLKDGFDDHAITSSNGRDFSKSRNCINNLIFRIGKLKTVSQN